MWRPIQRYSRLLECDGRVWAAESQMYIYLEVPCHSTALQFSSSCYFHHCAGDFPKANRSKKVDPQSKSPKKARRATLPLLIMTTIACWQIAQDVGKRLVNDADNPDHCSCGWYIYYSDVCGHPFTSHKYVEISGENISYLSCSRESETLFRRKWRQFWKVSSWISLTSSKDNILTKELMLWSYRYTCRAKETEDGFCKFPAPRHDIEEPKIETICPNC